jgi:hypothetical protein
VSQKNWNIFQNEFSKVKNKKLKGIFKLYQSTYFIKRYFCFNSFNLYNNHIKNILIYNITNGITILLIFYKKPILFYQS